MKTTKLILAAAVISAALFSQSALAFGAVWKYGGLYGFGKGVGAVADYKTQKEADRAALKQCEQKRPAYAARSKWGKCRIESQFQDYCAAFARFIIKGVKKIPHPDDPDAEPKTVVEDHSSILMHLVYYQLANPDTPSARYGQTEKSVIAHSKRNYARFACQSYKVKNTDYRTGVVDFGKNVNPKYRDDPHVREFQMDCHKPTYHAMVCDNVGYEAFKPPPEGVREGYRNGIWDYRH
ncbi:MAG: DUF4189 domain-containing protein [Betaproteobacteria bacterium]|nr:DUF4189 domain-containing protein [Betaproteobacteria bacterium]